MPELPEVETIARQLAPHLAGRRITSLRIFDPKLETPAKASLPGRKIVRVARSGKQICLTLSGLPGDKPGLWLLFHLRMTGRLILEGAQSGQNEKHLRASLLLDRGGLHFYDLRRFGLLNIVSSPAEAQPPGLDPLSPEFTVGKLAELIGSARQEIKPWLLRQDRLTGLGNIYASEILFAAGIGPQRAAATLEKNELRKLHRQIIKILRLAIENCGTTFSDFQDSQGGTGSFQRLLSVYAREGEPCARCGESIRKLVQQQRSTFFCPRCQK